jgi:hypothetical protein
MTANDDTIRSKMREEIVEHAMTYETLEEAIVAAETLMECMDTVVKITKEDNGKYMLFGNGEVVMVVE